MVEKYPESLGPEIRLLPEEEREFKEQFSNFHLDMPESFIQTKPPVATAGFMARSNAAEME
jgi:hypothetical protein